MPGKPREVAAVDVDVVAIDKGLAGGGESGLCADLSHGGRGGFRLADGRWNAKNTDALEQFGIAIVELFAGDLAVVVGVVLGKAVAVQVQARLGLAERNPTVRVVVAGREVLLFLEVQVVGHGRVVDDWYGIVSCLFAGHLIGTFLGCFDLAGLFLG